MAAAGLNEEMMSQSQRPPRVRTSKNALFCGTKNTCPGSGLSSCNPQLSYLCVECYTIIIIIINIIINITNPKP